MQHYLLSAKARTLTLKAIYDMGEDAAHQRFCLMRWPETDGEPVCPRCGCPDSYPMVKRRRFKCVGCAHQFSVTSGTIFANRKMSFTDLLAAIFLFANAAKGKAAIQISHDLGKSYKTMFVLLHKFRSAVTIEMIGRILDGIVETDGMYVGGYVRPANEEGLRVDRRLKHNRTGKRKSVVVMAQRGGDKLAMVADSERAAIPEIRKRLAGTARLFADEAPHWDAFDWSHEVSRVNHSIEFSNDGVCTNQAESYNSRLRRAEIGVHHRISGHNLDSYANEMAWRENVRRRDNGFKTDLLIRAAMTAPISRRWSKYWQRHLAA